MTGVAGTPWYVNHYFTNADDQTGADESVAAVQAFWDALDGLQANEVVGTIEALVSQINPVSGDLTGVWSTAGGSWQGDSAGQLLPVGACGLVQFRTGVFANGREVRGKTFVPGFTEDTNTATGTPGASTQTALVAAGTALMSADPSFCVYSPTNNLAAIVTSVTAWNKYAMVRSRRN